MDERDFHPPAREPEQPPLLSPTLRQTLLILFLGNLNGAVITALLFVLNGWGCK